MGERVALVIGGWNSTCGACGRNADPYEAAHVMENMVGEGCGATFTHVTTVYIGTERTAQEMRPDLPFTDFFGGVA